MDVRLMLVAAAAFGAANAAAAEPGKAPAAQPETTPAKERPVVLASAEVPASPAVATTESATPPAPARKRTARVTTCRCADTPNP